MASTSAKAVYNSGQWLRARALVLARDGRICQIKGPRCTGAATEVDHIVELGAGGAPFAPSNLRAACGPCNSSRPGRPGSGRATPSREW